ncbi:MULTISPECIES: alpha/beta fold hydrolase [Halomonas]|uniref:alpha/beta fold hydrolase n=1 Tax=Halomonas TaxID=2745 RepID=UPI001C98A59D|nr:MULTISPECIES: alpha/beta fold hydrolase [Halomonas]MBY6207144.1 alpha/beta fold hydrolase [Halomonas sp. DP3Y7-2]MBY6229738.1 alpha/beta fold hydrolase [Halomonas sp. DP3Y7-1]MCA0917930.1 alpha/beta fold hydrolase [Halomonas denitrificans]
MAVALELADSGGPGVPLVIVHGLLGSADNWRSHVKHWSQQRRVIAVDLRNHGRSPHADGMSYEDMAEDLADVITGSGADKVHLLGHSMGGKVVMSLARLYPDLVASLMVADIAPVAYEHRHDSVFAALRAVEASAPKDRREADELMAAHVEDKPTRMFLATNLVRGEGNVLCLRVNLDAIEGSYEDIMAEPAGRGPIRVPSIVIRGSRSDYVADARLAAVREVLPEASLETLDAGHWLHTEKAKEFQQCIDRFLEPLA